MSGLLGTHISEAIYIVGYLHKALKLQGDICEFGIAQGATSALLAHEIRETNKLLWLFDSFQGLPQPSEKDVLKDDFWDLGSIEAYRGTMTFSVKMVKKRLHEIDFPLSRVRIIPGFIEETIHDPYLPTSVCFAYVDFDFYEPVSIALNFLDKVLQTGGYVVVDDYDYFSTGVKTAVDEFVTTHKDKYQVSFPIKSAGNFCIIKKSSKNREI
jgi:hypothetical protein